jgi:hypothetical protein
MVDAANNNAVSKTGYSIMTHPQKSIPDPIAQLQQRLIRWRSANRPRMRLRDSFWNKFSNLAAGFFVHRP